MKTIYARLLLLISLCLILGGRFTHAQGCRLSYTPHYAIYENETTDGTYLYTSVLVDGSTSGSPSPGCNYPNARHTAKAYNMTGSTGGWLTGTPGYMTSYLSVQNNQNVLGGAGIIYLTGSGEVDCSVFGAFWNGGFNPVGIRFTTTYWGPPPTLVSGRCLYNILACSTGTPYCKSAVLGGIMVAPDTGCPSYARGTNVAVNDVCEFTIGIPASGPGPCS
jgi:hypothetical protein